MFHTWNIFLFSSHIWPTHTPWHGPYWEHIDLLQNRHTVTHMQGNAANHPKYNTTRTYVYIIAHTAHTLVHLALKGRMNTLAFHRHCSVSALFHSLLCHLMQKKGSHRVDCYVFLSVSRSGVWRWRWKPRARIAGNSLKSRCVCVLGFG